MEPQYDPDPVEAQLIGQLLAGVDPVVDTLGQLLGGLGLDPMDVSDAGLRRVIERWLVAFEQIPETRVRMAVARRAGIPYSEAMERWADPEDLAAEVAWDARLAAQDLRRCQRCGTDPDDVLDPDTKRPLPNGRLRIELDDCWMCQQLAHERKMLTDTQREAGTDLRIVPRLPGEPFVNAGTIE